MTNTYTLSKLLMTFFTEVEQITLEYIWNHKRPRIAKAILRKKNKAGGITLPEMRQYHKATVIKIVGECHTHTQNQTYGSMEQNRKLKNKPTHLQSIFNKGSKNMQWEKQILFSKWCWESWRAHINQ